MAQFPAPGLVARLGSEWYRPMDWRLPDGTSGFVAVSGLAQRRTVSYFTDPNEPPSANIDRNSAGVAPAGPPNWRELGEWRQVGWPMIGDEPT